MRKKKRMTVLVLVLVLVLVRMSRWMATIWIVQGLCNPMQSTWATDCCPRSLAENSSPQLWL
jgi:hypothetical protein